MPASPNGGGSTLGLQLAANIADPPGAEAVTVSPVGQSFSGTYQITFDMWINANGPFPSGGVGSTEFFTAGVGYDDATVNQGGASGSGGWFAVSGEGGSSRDYRGYHGVGEQFAESGQFFAGASSAGGGAHNGSDPYYAAFGNIDVATAVPSQTAGHPQQTGTTSTGSAGFAWHEVVISVQGTDVTWTIDGLPIAQLDSTRGAGFSTTGNISIGLMDIFTSVSDDADVSFALVDNLVVTDQAAAVPEPSSILLLTLGTLAVAYTRKRRS